tara:strand:- start:28166 stop:30562 length:2397 start_codon:yes stop_codon:yes gene_type:complete
MKYNNKNNKGLTLIEVLLAISIGAVAIFGFLEWQRSFMIGQRIETASKNIAELPQAVMRRVHHDGYDYSLWEGTYTTATPKPTQYSADDYMLWEGYENINESLIQNFLVAQRNEQCGVINQSWNPKNDDGTLDGGNETEIESTALVNCSLFANRSPMDLEFDALIKNDPVNVGYISGFRLYINFENSTIFSGSETRGGSDTDFNNIATLLEDLNNNLSPDLAGSQAVFLADKGAVETDLNDDNELTVVECYQAIDSGNECFVVLDLDFAGTNNQQFLRTDGDNSMFAPIDFAKDGADFAADNLQRCAYWEDDGAGNWTARDVDCGLYGGSYQINGNDPDKTQAVTNDTQTENLYITYRDGTDSTQKSTQVQNLCQLKEVVNGNTVEDDGANETDNFLLNTIATESPCGIMRNGDIIQLVTDRAYVKTVMGNNIVAEDFKGEKLILRDDPSNGGDMFIVEDSSGNDIFTISKTGSIVANDVGSTTYRWDGDTTFNGTLTANNDALFNSNVTMDLEDAERFVITNGTKGQLVFNNNIADPRNGELSNESFKDSGSSQSSNYFGVNFSGTGGNGLAIISDEDSLIYGQKDLTIKGEESTNIESGGDINIGSDGGKVKITGENSVYGGKSTFQNRTISEISGNANSNNVDELPADMNPNNFEFATMDYIKHLENLQSRIHLRYTNMVDSVNAVIPKPHCLDFVENDPDGIYKNTSIASNASPTDGRSLARIILVPLVMKTYNSAFGSNQAYTHQADDDGNQWKIYQFLSGEGYTGSGAREDGVGTSIAMVYCDYSGIDFKAP